MPHPSTALVAALRQTATRLASGAPYAWGSHGSCNCGHLAQVVTHFSADEIWRYAQQSSGEWTEIAEAWCPASAAPVDLVLHRLMDLGLTPTDIHHLEYLTDKAVLQRLPGGFRWLRRNVREDVVLYFNTLADMLEDALADAFVEEVLEEVELVTAAV